MRQLFTFLMLCTFATGAIAQTYNVTFQVNMNEVVTPFTTPEVNGTFNGWCGGCAAMSDPDLDGIWTITIPLDAGTYEFKYANDAWAGQETLTPGDPCTITTDIFTNRLLTVTEDVVMDPVCWGSCENCDGVVLTQMDLPVTFEDAGIEYGLIGFGGAEASTIEVDPTDPGNTVAKVIKSATAELWAGTTVTNPAGEGFASEIPFTDVNTTMSVRVWSPDAGIPVRLKVEDHLDPTHSVETETLTTVGGIWETLVFDFANEAPGTAALNLAYYFDKASIFFNFGTTGAVAGEKTYYFDDMMFGGGGDPMVYNVTFKVNMNEVAEPFTTPEVNGSFNGWCGGCNPLSDPDGDGIWETTLPITEGSYEFKYAYDAWAGQENLTPGDPCTITLGGFTNRTLNFAGDYIFDVTCWGSCSDCGVVVLEQMDLPVTFDDAGVEYGLVGFGGAEASTIETDPTDPLNMVAKVIKSATAELWAGTTVTNPANEGFATEIPFTDVNTLMSVRVWSPDSGIQIRLKVEDHLDPTKSVETEVTSTVAGDWETLVFDFANEAPGTAELNLGYNYDKASIFFNFGVTGAVAGEKTYYFDDVMFGAGGGPVTYNVTFAVNMNEVVAAFTLPEVNGEFTGWCGGCNPLSDPDGDGIWSTTLALEAGTYQYKFAYDAWAGSENLTAGDPCTFTDGGFTNRIIEVTEDIVLDNVCWGSCEACDIIDSLYDVTFIVDMNEVAEPFTTPEVNGTFNGWCGGCAPMSDADGDGVWELTIPLAAGIYEYKFAYDAWAGDETLLEGDPCTITAFGFTNRALEVSADAVLDTVCWGSCTSCDVAVPTYTVLFQVDMSTVTEAFTTPEVNGSFNGWCGGCAPMSDLDANGVWELAIVLPEGTHEYKFAYDAWAGQEELTEGSPCTSTIDGFTNRTINVTSDATLDVVCWALCTGCEVGINDIPETSVTIYPQPASQSAYIAFEGNAPISANIVITDITGRIMQETTIQQNNQILNLEGFAAGLYQILVVENNNIIYSGNLSVQ